MRLTCEIRKQIFSNVKQEFRDAQSILDFIRSKGKGKNVESTEGTIHLECDGTTLPFSFLYSSAGLQVKILDRWRSYSLSTDGLDKAIADLISKEFKDQDDILDLYKDYLML